MEKLHAQTYEYFGEINPAVIRNIPYNLRVLDVACGRGFLGEAIKRKGNYVVGIDLDKDSVNVSGMLLDEAYLADVACFEDLPAEVKNKRFDIILFGDILEHLYDPFTTLKDYQNLLKQNGRFIISIPNVVVWDIRLKFFFGIFNYTDTGVCDRTHIRYFTLTSMRRLIEAANLKIIKEDMNPGLLRPFVPILKKIIVGKTTKKDIVNRRTIMDSPIYKMYMKFVYPVEKIFCNMFKRLFAFQFIFVCEKK